MKNTSVNEQIIRFIETGSMYADSPSIYEEDSRSKRIELTHDIEPSKENKVAVLTSKEDNRKLTISKEISDLSRSNIADFSKDDIIDYARNKFNQEWQ